jgi:DNA-binding MarR family transcriptional regulator
MTAVKGDSPEPRRIDDFEPKHVGFLLDRVSKRMRHDLDLVAGETGMQGRHDPLTPSSFKLLSLIPAEGARVTDLASLAGMTKQALGQRVDLLEPLGYVETSPDPTDRRVRRINRTRLGDRVVADVNELYQHLDAYWRGVLGARRFETFMSVMVELAVGWDGPAAAGPAD